MMMQSPALHRHGCLGRQEKGKTMHWFWDHFLWLWLTVVVLPCMGLELFIWSICWIRASSIDWDPGKAEYISPGTLRRPKINLDKAHTRRWSWPALGVPLTAVGAIYYFTQLWWNHWHTYLALAIIWFFTTPIRKVAGVAVSRKVWHTKNLGKTLPTTWTEDARGFYHTGLMHYEDPYHADRWQPPCDPKNAFFKFINLMSRWFGRYGRFWHFWEFFRYWGIVVQAAVSLAWPVSVVVAPFYYMDAVDDYQAWMRPWWRRYRQSRYEPYTPPAPAGSSPN